jgi:hypothetical protein
MDSTMPMMREHMAELIRNNPNADYWELLVVRFAEALLAKVDEHLRGIPIEEAGLTPMEFEDYMNLPEGPLELLDGIPVFKRWRLAQEGRRRLGFASWRDESDTFATKSHEEILAEYRRRREALRNRPFQPSQVPFPSGPPED